MLRCQVGLFAITGMARRDHVIPHRAATVTARLDVVNGDVVLIHSLGTILTSQLVTKQNIATRAS